MTDLITQLAEIRERQGLEPIPDPRVIQGFDPGSPPAPPLDPRRLSESHAEEPEEFPDERPDTYQSPLVQAATPAPRRAVEVPVQPAPQTLPALELMVLDSSAAYRGHAVELNTQERGAVVSLVLRALQRVIEEQLAEVRRLEPQREVLGTRAATLEVRVPKRRRGRPRKVKT